MADISKLKQRILDDARSEAESMVNAARMEAEEILSDAQERTAAEQKQILSEAEAEAAEEGKRILSLAVLESRKKILATKRECIEEVFRMAIDKIDKLPDVEYFNVLMVLVLPALKTGNETLMLSPKDYARLPAEFASALNRKTGGKIAIQNGGTAIKSGFIIKEGDVEINGTFETASKMRRDSLEPEVFGMLFDG